MRCMLAITRNLVNPFMRNRLLSNIFIFLLILAAAIVLGKISVSEQPLLLLVVGLIGGVFLLSLAIIKLDLALLFILFFLIIPFTLGVHRLCQVLEVANFLILFTFICWLAVVSLYDKPVVKCPLNAPVFAFLGLVLLSYFRDPRSLTDSTNIHHIFAALSLMMYLLVSNIIKHKRQIYRIRHAFFAFYNAAFLVTLYIAFTGARIPLMTQMQFSNRAGGTPFTSGGGVHGVGQYGISCILFLLCQPSYIPSKLIRGSLLTTYFASLLLSGGRSVLLVLLGTLFLMLLSQKKIKHLVAITVMIVALFIYIPRYYYSLPAVVQRMFTFSRQESSIYSRLSMWKASWELIQKRPIFGIGYGLIESSQLSFIPHPSMVAFSRGPHNGYVFIARSSGLVGIGILGWMIFTFFKEAFRLKNKVENPHIQQFVFFVIVQMIAILIGIAGGGGELRPSTYLFMGLISAIYAMHPIPHFGIGTGNQRLF